MKFSKFLEAQQSASIFRGQWVTYRSLKRLIKNIVQIESSSVDHEVYASQLWWYDSSQRNSLGSVSNERKQFTDIVEKEINRTAHFYSSRRKQITDKLSEIQQRIEGRFALNLLKKDIDEISAELILLERFIHQAKQLLLKITKKNDKKTSEKVSRWMLIRLEREEFWNPKLGDLIVGISDAYAIARALPTAYCGSSSDDEITKKNENNKKNNNIEEYLNDGASQDFVRKNEKYFIRPEDVLLVKMAISKHLSLDIFGRKTNVKKDGTPCIDLEALRDIEDSTVINSVYLDNDEKTMYHQRTGIETKKGNLLRIRWYGSHPNPPKECFMERKTRQSKTDSDEYKIDEAVKERFMLKRSDIMSYMNGEWNVDKKVESMRKKKNISKKEAEELTRKANSMQQEILSKSLRGVLRTVVRRSAFQEGRDQSLRISLDSNLHIINEDVVKSGWARDLSHPIRLSEVKTLPYAILEVKTQTTPPEWLKDLVQSGLLLHEGAHFSKFQYGSCKLSPETVRFTPTFWPNVAKLEQHPPVPMPMSIFCSVSPCKLYDSSSPNPPLSLPSSLPISFTVPQSIPSLSSVKSKQKSVTVSSSPIYPASSPPSLLSIDPYAPSVPQAIVSPLGVERYEKRKSDGDAILEYKLGNDGFPKKERWFQLDQMKSNISSFFGIDKYEPAFTKIGKADSKQRVMQQRSAKAFFANERTLLSWLNTASFLSLTGLTLLNTGSTVGKISGLSLTLGTVFFAAYALYKYCLRLSGLSNPKPSETVGDKIGPAILIVAFCFALLLSSIYFLI